MCGILGITGKDIENEKPQDLISLISHRGPDVSGTWQSRDKSVWLGHTRLSIIELSKLGNQPMKSVCGNFVLIYNGEIYNHLEVRRNLINIGYKFRGESDTEVVLNACIEWGVEMASKLFIGMFAFAFFNNKENSLWLSRDKLGIKPLYFIYEDNNFAFSSEIRPILKLSWVKKTINKCSLINYFRYGNSSAPNTIINNINQLEAGTILLKKNSNIKFFKYWDHRKIAYEGIKIRNNSISFREYSELLEAELKKSIKNHLQSDVNYGAFISGGIDSSIVCSLMQSESSKSIKTFSLGFSEKSHDESKYAADIANYLGTDHNEIILTPKELISSIPEIINTFDEPFADNSYIPTYLISKFARESVKVCLSGDGGDELFGGYPRYYWAKRIENTKKILSQKGSTFLSKIIYSIPSIFWNKFVDQITFSKFSNSENLDYRIKRFAYYLKTNRENIYEELLSIYKNPKEILNSEFLPFEIIAEENDLKDISWADEMMLLDQINYLQDDILTKVDRASMAVSLETRVPLLTSNLVELSWKLPLKTKFSPYQDQGKLILKDILSRYIPKSYYMRQKKGFGMPLNKWFRNELRDWIESLLLPSDLESCGLNSKNILMLWEKQINGENYQSIIWAIICYLNWYKKNII
tara:strand:- start:8222 stop:10141 length:1920 start_codon:yes stop_codon:yes gene_type:complete